MVGSSQGVFEDMQRTRQDQLASICPRFVPPAPTGNEMQRPSFGQAAVPGGTPPGAAPNGSENPPWRY